MKNLLKAIVFLLLISLAGLLIGCSSEPPRWKNTYIQFYPDDLETLYVRHGNTEFNAESNGENYQIEYLEFIQNNTPMFRITVTSYNHDIHYAWFTGYNNLDKHGETDYQAEINWKKQGRSFSAEGELLRADFYQIDLSQDKDN